MTRAAHSTRMSEWLKHHRVERRMTQAQVAAIAEVTEQTIRNWERRRGAPSAYSRDKLMAFFKQHPVAPPVEVRP